MPRRSSKLPAVPAIDAGLRLLARRAHSRREMWQKLSRRGYSEEEAQGAIARLVELGYLDDAAFAEGHVRRRSSSLGPMALGAQLAARGVDRRAAGAALVGFDVAAQTAVATRLAERLCAVKRPAGYRELLNSVGAKLLRRGFSQAVAREACRAAWAGTTSTPETEAPPPPV